jgi:hypothetical protein
MTEREALSSSPRPEPVCSRDPLISAITTFLPRDDAPALGEIRAVWTIAGSSSIASVSRLPRWCRTSTVVHMEGLLEPEVRLGDRLRIGSASFMVTQPRMPCFKLGIRFDDDHMVKRFLRSGRTGFYVAVLREGDVAAGDPIELTERDDHGVTVSDITALYARSTVDRDLLRRAIDVPALPQSWKDFLRKRLQ